MRILPGAVAISCSLLAACSCSLLPPEPPDASPLDAAAPVDQLPAHQASAVIGPAGGTLTHPMGATLVFPAGALAGDTTITIDAVSPTARGFRWVGPAFQFGPPGIVFAKPVSLTLPWDAARLAGDSPTHVAAYVGPDAPTAFRPERSTVDATAHTVATAIGHFTQAGAGVPVAVPFQPHDLLVAQGALWVVSDYATSTIGPGGALWRLDDGSLALAPWQSGWEDAWGITLDGADALVTARRGAPWEVLDIGLATAMATPRSTYTAPSSGVATALHGLAFADIAVWSGFQQCNFLYDSLAPATGNCAPSGGTACHGDFDCVSGNQCVVVGSQASCDQSTTPPPLELADSVVHLDDCQFSVGAGREFATRFGERCLQLVDAAPSPSMPGDIVASDALDRVVYVVGSNGLDAATVIGVAGSGGTAGFRDGPVYDPDPSVRALFDRPQGLAVAGDGSVYVADTNNHAIRRISSTGGLGWGEVCTVWGGPTASLLDHPESVALDDNDTALWVSDSGNRRLVYLPLLAEPVPAVTQLAPSTIMGGSADTTLTVSGTGFELDSTVIASGDPLATTYVSPTELSAIVPASLLGAATTLDVTVRNGCPGGGPSNGSLLTVTNATPTLTDVAPRSIATGSPDTTLTLSGGSFAPTGQAFWGATALQTTVTSATTATAVVSASLLASDAQVPVTFVNPTPGGGTSSAIVVTVVSYVEAYGVPTVLVSGLQRQPMALVTDGVNLYWTGASSGLNNADGTVNAMSVDGGAVTVLTASEFQPDTLALRSGTLYWADVWGQTRTLPTTGGTPTMIGTEQFGQPLDIAVDGNGIFVLTSGAIARFPPGSQFANVIANNLQQPRHLVIGFETQNALWTSSADATLRLAVETSGTVGGQPLETGPSGTNAGLGIAIAPSGSVVYYVAYGPQNGAILSYDDMHGAGTVAVAQKSPYMIATDGVSVYWTLAPGGGQSGSVIRSDSSGGLPTRLTTQVELPGPLVVDGTSLYWIDVDPGANTWQIAKIAK